VVGIAALGASWSPAAQARGSVSISVGTGSPYYGAGYGGGYGAGYGGGYGGHDYQQHRPGYVLVPGHWVSTYRGRVWVPAQSPWMPTATWSGSSAPSSPWVGPTSRPEIRVRVAPVAS
jgi:hypothetical protein